MRIEVLTLFPELFEPFFSTSLMGKARENGLVQFGTVPLRKYGSGRHQQVDDVPYGGGAGMVMKPEPLAAAIREARSPEALTIYLTPQGEPLTQRLLVELSTQRHLLLLCGRYEGVDERLIEAEVDREVSVGDYVVTGGEVPAMLLMEGVVRLIPGVVKEYDSLQTDSFFDIPLLDHPHYTRPREWEGRAVPEVLLSGNHADIAEWRRWEQLRRTLARRPELLRQLAEQGELSPQELAWLSNQQQKAQEQSADE